MPEQIQKAPINLDIPCFSFKPNQPIRTTNNGRILDSGKTFVALPRDRAVISDSVPKVADKEAPRETNNNFLFASKVEQEIEYTFFLMAYFLRFSKRFLNIFTSQLSANMSTTRIIFFLSV